MPETRLQHQFNSAFDPPAASPARPESTLMTYIATEPNFPRSSKRVRCHIPVRLRPLQRPTENWLRLGSLRPKIGLKLAFVGHGIFALPPGFQLDVLPLNSRAHTEIAIPYRHESSIVKTLALLTLFALTAQSASNDTPAAFTDVTAQTISNGFRAASVYLNDADQPFGARFIHQKTGFTLDLIQVQSVPQAFVWVNSFPVSDKGEPHTQEHLLMG